MNKIYTRIRIWIALSGAVFFLGTSAMLYAEETLCGELVSADAKKGQIVIKSTIAADLGTKVTIDVPSGAAYQNCEGLAKIPVGSLLHVRVESKKGKQEAKVVSVAEYPKKEKEIEKEKQPTEWVLEETVETTAEKPTAKKAEKTTSESVFDWDIKEK